MEITYVDKLKSIFDKDIALNNSIIEADYGKFQKIVDKNPEILAVKHSKILETLKTGAAKKQAPKMLAYDAMERDISHRANLQYAQHWIKQNGLALDDNKGFTAKSVLQEYLNNDKPSFKEPIIAYIKEDITNIKELTAEKLDRKLDDISLSNFGGKKITEVDKEAVIRFATVECIKSNDVELYKHLDKEFNIVRNGMTAGLMAEDLNYIAQNAGKNSELYKYHDAKGKEIYNSKDFTIPLEKTQINTGIISAQKLNVVEQTTRLESAMKASDYVEIRKAIISGADERVITKESLREFDTKTQVGIWMAKQEAVSVRNASLPEGSQYKINEEKNYNLKVAFFTQDAPRVAKAIKEGADPAALREIPTAHMDKKLLNELHIAVNNAVNQKSNTQTKDNNIGSSLNM